MTHRKYTVMVENFMKNPEKSSKGIMVIGPKNTASCNDNLETLLRHIKISAKVLVYPVLLAIT